MDTYEVAAIGDLYKKNPQGRRTWNLREFALTGVQLIYYKKGVKRGEWDISGCKIRKISAEEAQQPAAKFAFAIEGPKKQFLLSANNEKNRELWISVLEKQIHEFRNPVRRFIRTGEVVHANGFVKRRNLFGKTPILLVVTNFPRIIEIDPATIELKDQYSWVQTAPPTLKKLSDSKFLINVGGKELRFEDPANGMPYWEALFSRVARMELWKPTKQPTLRIGFPKKSNPTGAIPEKAPGTSTAAPSAKSTASSEMKKEVKPETSKDLKFLEEALAHIQELLTTLNSKIDEIDVVFAKQVQEGSDSKEDTSASAADRQTKRSQLLMLKENIDVIADNLKSLIKRSKETGSALFDVAAIESVISEAATLLVLLNSDDEDLEEVEEVEETEVYNADVNKIDEMVAKIEEEVFEIEEKISSGEVAPLVPEPRVEELAAPLYRGSVFARGSVLAKYVEPVTDLEINQNTYDPNDPNKRPDGWLEVRMKRILIKEQKDREIGIDEDTIQAARAQREIEEETLMLEEVRVHGQVQGLKTGGRKRSSTLQQDVSNLEVNSDNFDFPNPAKRPFFWNEVRTKRVMLKEHIERINGVPEATLTEKRPTKEVDEEMTLVSEVLAYGRLLNVGESKPTSLTPSTLMITEFTFNTKDLRPNGWNEVKEKRIQLKELEDRLNGEDEAAIKEKRTQRLIDEEEAMVDEASENGIVLLLGTRQYKRKAVHVHVEHAVLQEQVAVQEEEESTEMNQETFAPEHVEIEEPVQYADVTISFGTLAVNTVEEEPEYVSPPAVAPAPHIASAPASPEKPVAASASNLPEARGRRGSVIAREEVQEDVKSFDDTSDRPKGWAEIKLRRVYLKEWEDRKNGVDEDDIMDKRYARELEAEQEMIAELGVKGKIALFEAGGLKKPVKRTYKPKAKEELTNFLTASSQTISNINAKLSKVVIKE